ncbi:MAG: T9SS type A sorting domain-containing protein [Bacteroidia bacterium]|nr:T9SS type A sorting domain-containing protein [Bacteroidia bacterium]
MLRLLLLCLFPCGTGFSQIFTLVDSIQLPTAQIWGVCSDDGDSLCITTVFIPTAKPHIYMRKVNYANIVQQSTPKQLTFDPDFTSITNLTDHKSIIHNNEIYVTFSTQGDQDLFIFKTDINGNRIGNIVTVVSGSADPTNDMILVTDGTYIYVLHFDPPNQHHVYTFDSNLNAVSAPFSTTTNGHNNIGNALFLSGNFHMFTGSTFGFNSNLLYTTWSSNWAPLSTQNVLSSVSGDGNWFSNGEVYDSANQRWYIGMNHIYNSQNIGQEHIDLLAFDNAFNLLERIHVTPIIYNRPHMVLKNGFLYLAYDRPGVAVYLHKYQVQNSSGLGELPGTTPGPELYPNPSTGRVYLEWKNFSAPLTVSIEDLRGVTVKETVVVPGSEIQLNTGELESGIYFMRLKPDQGEVITKKLLLIR